MIDTKILINHDKLETRIAVLENNTLVEIYVERRKELNLLGNIYKGKVVKILPGMQSAFVDIGLEKAGFLYVSDVFNYLNLDNLFLSNECIDDLDNFEEPHLERNYHIEDLLKEGQEILVQIAKEPLGSKGARLTSHITIPGKHLVLLPTLTHIGISKKIYDEKERDRLKIILESNRGNDKYGVIARTASEGVSPEELRNDKDFLVKIWDEIKKKYEQTTGISLLHRDLNLPSRVIRDFYSANISEIIVDNSEHYDTLKNFIDIYLPKFKNRISFYNEKEMLFEKFNIEIDYKKLLNRRIWLKSGGYIVIDKTEALTAIDVNTGKFVGKVELEETVFQTNIEAAKEIAYQLRLRNIGGIIVIDFIDMHKKEYKEKVSKIFEDELKNDRNRVNILKISELGLIEMTRKRTQDDIISNLTTTCPICEGKGLIKSATYILCSIYRNIIKNQSLYRNRKLILTVHPYIGEIIMEDERDTLEWIERELEIQLEIKFFKKTFSNNIETYEIETEEKTIL